MAPVKELPKLSTGIAGLDEISNGGLPRGRSTLIAGTAGSGKTVLALQFLYCGVHFFEQNGVLVTFEETPVDMMANVASFGWGLEEMVEANKIAIVDAAPDPSENVVEAGGHDLAALMARIEGAVRRVKADRVILDAVGALFPQFSDSLLVRRELQRILAGLRELGVTTIINLERTDDEGAVGRFGIEEFVADNVLLMRNRLDMEKRRRTIEILKFRGATHQKGEYPFTIDDQDGVTVLPLSATSLQQSSSDTRLSSGVKELDDMCGGGIYRDSIILVSGATGTGKTLMVTEYVKAAITAGQRVLLIGAEESRDQLGRNAKAWGADFDKAEADGLLKIICRYPEVMGLEDHLLQIKRDIREFQPTRIAVDSLSAFERVSSTKSFREFVIGITGFIKDQQMTGLFTNTTSMLIGGESVTETHISTITDSIILLRYVELFGEMRRGLTVLKMRGTWHEKEIREYVIDGNGMSIKGPFKGVHGILSGMPTYSFTTEAERMETMFTPSDRAK
ncbi:circadian clock protein KaiC [Acuticoccus sp. I52.16.1]|uniref:circadian clock protein KaiC n=1 Tax=Acuticoccus sp. I52.16.1 TaxID=2928472 RepID=UPI001FD5706A|nr:circadian clock protein KaiC [Acuticoccus sp. I52.16.1]UOM34761.1 circadian clock protein KaiC [Acuticoccus sp. I52.16.1]